MPAEKPIVHGGNTSQRLLERLRTALVSALAFGSWSQIKRDHKKVGLAWREDLDPGWGKSKYVERVIDDLADDEAISLARRTIDRVQGAAIFAIEDALLWLDAGGVARVSELTRIGFATVLEGCRLHPGEGPSEVLGKFARPINGPRFEYSENGALCVVDIDLAALFESGSARRQTVTKSSHLALLDAYGVREWPDARLFRFIEYLVHPTVRRGADQAALVTAINSVLAADRFELTSDEAVSGHPVFKVRPTRPGVAGRPKNLIFASTGPKPELGFADAVNNDIVILRHAEHCLVYDDPIGEIGLRWSTLVEWWAVREGLDPAEPKTRKNLADRLLKSLDSEPERRLFAAYFKAFRPRLAEALPALVPQVYLHYDPVTLRELRARGDERRFDVQRMDFLLLLPHSVRVVVEVDGQQHYSVGSGASARPSPAEYARTVRGDRHLRLAGYEVYRFGGHELRNDDTCSEAVVDFFTRLFRSHQLLTAS